MEKWEEWDDEILYPALDEIKEEKGISLECEGNGNSGEILTIWSKDENIRWEESVYNDYEDDDWDEDEDDGYYSLNIVDPEEKFSTKEELKAYILSMMIIKN